MPRPKGSQSKAKTAIPTTTDFADLIAAEAAAKDALTADIAALEENLETIKADLKAKKAELKKLDTELSKVEDQKVEADAKAAEKAQRAEMEDTIQKLMATGVTAAEILEKLKCWRNGKRYFGGRKIVLDM